MVLEARNHHANPRIAAIVGTTMASMMASEFDKNRRVALAYRPCRIEHHRLATGQTEQQKGRAGAEGETPCAARVRAPKFPDKPGDAQPAAILQ